MNILVTGAAGFIGYHVCRALLEQGHRVTGVDNLNRYYDPALKKARLARLRGDGFIFRKADICDLKRMRAVFRRGGFTRVVHLAAQAGVRYSLEAPFVYQKSNNEGQLVILEL
jgi:UDP-glucuronate 4-epimerase